METVPGTKTPEGRQAGSVPPELQDLSEFCRRLNQDTHRRVNTWQSAGSLEEMLRIERYGAFFV